MRVLVSNLLMRKEFPRFESWLKARGITPVKAEVKQYLSESELLALFAGEGFDGVLAGDDQFTETVFAKATPKLKAIAKWGTGIDSIDLAAAKHHNVPVYNSPGAFKDAVAEVALGYMLMLSRHLHTVDQAVRRGEWPKPTGQGMVGKRLGILGFGAIGRGVSARAKGFGLAKILAHDPMSVPAEEGVELVSLDALLQQSDILCLCCNLSPENHHLLNAARLAKMPYGAMIINVARGPLIDESALLAALQTGQIGSAGLDVFEAEPLPASHPFASMPNVALGSHNANNLHSANEYVHRNTLKNLCKGLGIPVADEELAAL